MSLVRRKRKCESCGKPLGGTVVECFDCGGEKPSPSKEERLVDAKTWATLLGVEHDVVQRVHEEALGGEDSSDDGGESAGGGDST